MFSQEPFVAGEPESNIVPVPATSFMDQEWLPVAARAVGAINDTAASAATARSAIDRMAG